MKILLCTQLFSPAVYGGGEVVFLGLSKELARRGYEVIIVTQKLLGSKSYEKVDGVKIFRVGLPIKYKGFLPISFFQNLSFLICSFFKVLFLKPDIIHSNTYIPCLSCQLASKIIKKPHIITVHDVYFLNDKYFWKKWGEQKSVGIFSKFLGKFVEKLVLSMKVSMIHTVSATSKKDILKVSKKNEVIVVPNGIELSGYKSDKKAKRDFSRIVYIGRLVFYKNLNNVLEAVKKNPKIKLSVAGEGPMREEWEKLAFDLGISDRVEFLGLVNEKIKKELLSSCLALVQPSKVEGFGLTLVEAMSFGTPCIVNDVKPLTDIVKDGFNGLVVKGNDWDEKIKKLVNNKELFSKLSSNAFDSSKKYNVSSMAEILIQKIYSKISL